MAELAENLVQAAVLAAPAGTLARAAGAAAPAGTLARLAALAELAGTLARVAALAELAGNLAQAVEPAELAGNSAQAVGLVVPAGTLVRAAVLAALPPAGRRSDSWRMRHKSRHKLDFPVRILDTAVRWRKAQEAPMGLAKMMLEVWDCHSPHRTLLYHCSPCHILNSSL